jgi:LmbE family N-acetylglucosaminyl deacetylase
MFLVLFLLLTLESPLQAQPEIRGEDWGLDSCLFCDLPEVTSQDIERIISGLIQPLASTLSNFITPADDELHVKQGLRVVIFSPHPDDETLAAGGLMHRVVEAGGEVRVVLVTNGDGYPEAVRRQLGHPARTSHDFIEYGRSRLNEAQQAVCEVGLQRENLIFLGFPDDGVDDLLNEHWSKLRPYTSPYTNFTCAGYRESFKRWAVYAGVNLKDEIARILVEFCPDWIILPDPRDYHPDHCATGLFVLEALRQLNQDGKILVNNIEILTYLVHFEGYPTSPNWMQLARRSGFFMSSTGCGILSSTEWLELPLANDDLDAKKRALSAYQSQEQMLGGFFKFFSEPREIFGRLEPVQALAIPQQYTLTFRQPNS